MKIEEVILFINDWQIISSRSLSGLNNYPNNRSDYWKGGGISVYECYCLTVDQNKNHKNRKEVWAETRFEGVRNLKNWAEFTAGRKQVGVKVINLQERKFL